MHTIIYKNKEVFPLLNDAMFKTIFNDKGKRYIRALLNDVLELHIEHDEDITVMNTELDTENIEEKRSRLDLVVKTKNELVNVEVQVVNEYDIEARAAYYLSRLHASNLEKGKEYEEGRKTIVLLILDFNINEEGNVLRSCSLRYDDYEREQFTNVVQIYIMELRKLDKNIPLNEKSKWQYLFSMRNEKELKKVRLASDMMANIVTRMVQVSAEERMKYLAIQHEKVERDDAIRLQRAKEKGLAIGKEQGIEQGLAIGIMKTAKNLKLANVDVDIIVQTTGLSKEKINEL